MLKYIFIALATLILAVISAVGIIIAILLWRPGWLINESNLQWAQETFLPEYDIPWEKLDLKLEKTSEGTYSVFLSGIDFCQEIDPYGKACFDELLIDLEVKASFRKLKSIYIKNLIVKDQLVAITVPASPKDQKKELNLSQLKEQLEGYISYLDNVRFGAHEILLDETSIQFEGAATGPIKVALASGEGLEFEVIQNNLNLEGTVKKVDKHLALNASLSLPLGKASLHADISISKVNGNLEFHPGAENLRKYIDKIETQLKIDLTSEALSLGLHHLNVSFNQEPLKNLEAIHCRTLLALSMNEDIQFNCETVHLGFDLSQLDFKNLKSKIRDFPKTLTFRLESTIPVSWLEESPLSSGDALAVSVEAEPIKHSLFQFDLAAQSEIKLSKEGWSLIDPSLNVSLFISKFQNLVSRLEGSRFSVPAPFHVLNGSLKAEVKEIPKASSNLLSVPFIVSSNLTSERNAVVGEVNGKLDYYFSPSKAPPSLSLDILIDKLYLQLPPFDPVRGIPSLTPDSRITKKLGAKKEPKAPIDLDIQVRTTKHDSIRLYHKFIEPFAGFGLVADVEEETGFKITKSTSDFDINYLNRSVTVQNLKLNKKSTQKDIFVSGQLLYEAAGYDIFIRMSGPTDKPEVVLTSDPPLNRRDIISVLLYNRVNDDIASFEQENVGGTEAAIADRAIGLFGIWAFASTPIEAVSYNSVTGTYSAQIKLPEGFRFSIGTDWESVQNLELRRRISGPWIVSTIYRPQTDDDEGAGEIMLQRKTSY